MRTGLVSAFLGERICTEVVELPSAGENMDVAVLETRAVWVPVATTKGGPAIELACAARWHGNVVAVDDVRFSLGSCPLSTRRIAFGPTEVHNLGAQSHEWYEMRLAAAHA